jgi:hypothetical protein
VNIRFTSSLTDNDENLLAPTLLKAICSILDLIPIAYVIRIDTSDANVYQQTRTSLEVTVRQPESDKHDIVVAT